VFDRCDADTVAIIDLGTDESRRLGHDWLGTEHLLLAIGQHREVLPAAADRLLPDAGALRAALARVLSAPPPGTAPELLKTVGVDLDQVRAAVRQTFGDEAIERLSRRRVHQPWQPWRRPSRRCTSLLTDSRSVAPRLKQAFERARHEADRRQLTTIDPATLLIGMIDVEDALSNRLLDELGIDPQQLRQALLPAPPAAAPPAR
jgi:ATP-dependent Clp protease ATP-binding subunit ClpA